MVNTALFDLLCDTIAVKKVKEYLFANGWNKHKSKPMLTKNLFTL